MINIKDIMVGNFIKNSEGEVVKVEKIYESGVSCNCRVLCYEDTIEPIPITKEILNNIGFEEYDDLPLEGKFYRYWDKDYKYKLAVRDFWTNSQRKWYVHIDNDVCNTIGSGEFDYLHELQNLVRINCKADLPITKDVFDGLDD